MTSTSALLDGDDAERAAALESFAGLPPGDRMRIARELQDIASSTAGEMARREDEGEELDELEDELERAICALGRTPEGLPAVLALARHESAVVRSGVVSGLRPLRNEASRSVVAQLVRDADADVQKEAARAIQADPRPEAVGDLEAAVDAAGVPAEEVSAALAAAAAVAPPEVQARVASTLLRIAGGALDQPRPHQQHLCRRALDALVRFGATFPGVQAAAAGLAASDDQRTRITGVALIAGGGDEASFARLLELAARGSTDESAHANVHLRALPPTVVAPALVRNMASDDPLVRARAAELSVGTIFLAREAKIEPLLALTKDPDEGVRAAAVASLGRALPPGKAFFGDRKGVIAPALDGLASDPSTKVQEALQRARKVLGLG